MPPWQGFLFAAARPLTNSSSCAGTTNSNDLQMSRMLQIWRKKQSLASFWLPGAGICWSTTGRNSMFRPEVLDQRCWQRAWFCHVAPQHYCSEPSVLRQWSGRRLRHPLCVRSESAGEQKLTACDDRQEHWCTTSVMPLMLHRQALNQAPGEDHARAALGTSNLPPHARGRSGNQFDIRREISFSQTLRDQQRRKVISKRRKI